MYQAPRVALSFLFRHCSEKLSALMRPLYNHAKWTMTNDNTALRKMLNSPSSFTQDTAYFLYLGFANSDVHFVEGDQPTMYANGPG